MFVLYCNLHSIDTSQVRRAIDSRSSPKTWDRFDDLLLIGSRLQPGGAPTFCIPRGTYIYHQHAPSDDVVGSEIGCQP